MPVGFGPNLVSKLVEPCSDTNCETCPNNNAQCTACKAAATGYCLNPSTKSCDLTTSFGLNEGCNVATRTKTSCSITGCRYCRANHLQCTECDSTSRYYLWSNTNCYTPATMPLKKGPDLQTGLVVACQNDWCDRCPDSHQECTACTAGTSYCLFPALKSCELKTTAPSGSGCNLATTTISSCTLTGCDDCKSTHSACLSCDFPNGYYFYQGSCLTTSQIPTLVGPNLLTGVVEACSDTNCRVCNLDKLKCESCKSGTSYCTNSAARACELKSSAPTGVGCNLVTVTFETCVDSGCADCRNDRATCVTCDTGKGYFMKAGVCVHTSVMPDTFGPDLATGLVQSCFDTQCRVCNFNHLQCQTCKSGTVYCTDFAAKSCVLKSSAPLGFGCNLNSVVQEACSDTGCADCREDSSICVACDTSRDFYMYQSVCTLIQDIPTYFGANLQSGFAVDCADTLCHTCNLDYSKCTRCDDQAIDCLQEDKFACLPKLSIEGYFGCSPQTNKVEPCSQGCLDCKLDSLKCSICDVENGWFLLGEICQNRSMMAKGSGPHLVLGTVVKCVDVNCEDCLETHDECNRCYDPPLIGYCLNTTSRMCEKKETIPEFMGCDLTTTQMQACRSEGCSHCVDDRTKCTKCSAAMGFAMQDGTCVDVNTLAFGRFVETIIDTVQRVTYLRVMN